MEQPTRRWEPSGHGNSRSANTADGRQNRGPDRNYDVDNNTPRRGHDRGKYRGGRGRRVAVEVILDIRSSSGFGTLEGGALKRNQTITGLDHYVQKIWALTFSA